MSISERELARPAELNGYAFTLVALACLAISGGTVYYGHDIDAYLNLSEGSAVGSGVIVGVSAVVAAGIAGFSFADRDYWRANPF